MTSWLARLLGWEAEIPAGELEAVLAYLAKEWRLKALQDLEAERYNNAVTKYGGAMIPGSAGLAELLSAARRLSQVADELVRRHSDLQPVPDEAGSMYFAWALVYSGYQEWATATALALEGYEVGAVPHTMRVQQLFGQMEGVRKKAEQEEGKLLRRLRPSAEDARRRLKEAKDAAEAEDWQPS